MYRLFVLSLLTVLLPASVFAQVELPASVLLEVGDTFRLTYDRNTRTFDPGTSGPGQLWDFRNLENNGPERVTITAPANTAYASNYPAADRAYTFNQITEYLELAGNTLQEHGFAGRLNFQNNSIERPIVYSAPLPTFNLPAQVGAQASGTAATVNGFRTNELNLGVSIPSAFVDSIRLNRVITREVEVDASGTLYLPTDTLQNVLRVVTREFYLDSTFARFTLFNPPRWVNDLSQFAPGTPTVFNDTLTRYTWWSADLGIPLLSVWVNNAGEVDYRGIQYYTSRLFTNRAAQAAALPMALYPNPTTGTVFLQLPDALTNAQVELRDLAGRVLLQAPLVGPSHTLQLADLPAGVYTLRVAGAQGVATQRIVLQPR
jgi:hypothetical protein